MKKRMLLIALCALGFTMLVPTQNAFARNKPTVVTTYYKEGGEAKLFGVFMVRYREVWDDIEYKNGKYWCTVWCEGPGDLKCKKEGGVKTVSVNHGTIDGAFIDNYESMMLDEIDQAILEDKTYSGTLSKKVQVKNMEGNYTCTLVFAATWTDGNEFGDAHVTIELYDVTDEFPQLPNIN